MPDQPTVRSVLDDAIAASARLAEVGEAIDDEWGYIDELGRVWQDRLEAIAAARGDEPVTTEVVDAIAAAIAEVDRITDPHRAIDWLSTFPQVVCLALGERP
jgi:hypothetical protein